MGRKSVSSTFVWTLGIISILGFLVIVGDSFFSKYISTAFLNSSMPGIILIVLGFGLVVEAGIRNWRKFPKDGKIDAVEVTHIVTGVIGVFSLIAGILALAGVSTPTLEATKGIVSTIAILLIAIQLGVK